MDGIDAVDAVATRVATVHRREVEPALDTVRGGMLETASARHAGHRTAAQVVGLGDAAGVISRVRQCRILPSLKRGGAERRMADGSGRTRWDGTVVARRRDWILRVEGRSSRQ
jgi:hypothetical protein